MIPRANVTAWRRRVPWTEDAQVEQDLVLSRALVEMFSQQTISEQLAFRGGTALNKLFFEPAVRFSEDIDLVQIEAGPIGTVMNTIRDRLDGWLGAPSTKQGRDRVSLLYRFDSELQPAGRRRLKIEINTREHFSVLGLSQRQFDVSNPWFEGASPITVFQLDELMGTKLRALYQRKKGRDLFDLSVALSRPDILPARIVDCFLRYMEHGETSISRAQFEANLAAKAKDRAFVEDIAPLLAPGVIWNFDEAVQSVSEKLVTRLPGESWKGSRT